MQLKFIKKDKNQGKKINKKMGSKNDFYKKENK